MPKTKISDYSQTAASNTDINSINLGEGMLPSDVNNAIRELMKQIKDFQVGAQGDPLTVGGSFVASGGMSVTTMAATGIFTASGGTILSGTNTMSGSNIISGNINSSGTTNTFSGGNILSGTNTLSGSTIISGNINSSGTTNTFSGGNIFSGSSTFSSGNLKLSGSSSGTATLNAPAAASTNTYTLPPDAATLGYRNVPQVGSDKTTSYTLATGDVGKFVGVGASGSITIPDATFAAGDVISLFNNTTGNITITCSITTAYIAGTDSDKATMTLATRGVATILFLSGTVCVVSGNVT